MGHGGGPRSSASQHPREQPRGLPRPRRAMDGGSQDTTRRWGRGSVRGSRSPSRRTSRGAREALPEENQIRSRMVDCSPPHPSGRWQRAQHGRPQRPHAPPPGYRRQERRDHRGSVDTLEVVLTSVAVVVGVSSIGAYGVNPRDVVQGDPRQIGSSQIRMAEAHIIKK